MRFEYRWTVDDLNLICFVLFQTKLVYLIGEIYFQEKVNNSNVFDYLVDACTLNSQFEPEKSILTILTPLFEMHRRYNWP